MPYKNNMKIRHYCVKCLIAIAIFAIAATNLFCYNTGDYRTKWGGNFETLELWECYNGIGWIDATQLPSSPFVNTIYISNQTVTMNSSMIIEGGLVIVGTLQLASGAILTINPSVNCEIGVIETYSGSTLINNGFIKANSSSSSLKVHGGILENNGIITSSAPNNCNVYINSNGRINFGNRGSITGNCSFTTNYGSIIATANTQGLDGSLNCSGDISFNQIYLIYNGTEPQITGMKTPDQVLGIDFNNPAGITLSKNIKLIYTALVHSGTTLYFDVSIIKEAWYGSGTFSMEDGSTIATANPDGFCSTGNKGSVQVGTRNYNSNGNYIFNGTEHQQTGDFNTTPDAYTVNDIIFDNPTGVTLTHPITVVSTLELLEGDINYTVLPQGVDGFYSPDVKKTVILKNGTLMYNFLADSLPFQNNGEYVNRKWYLKGNFNGSKKVTFYWSENEDDNCNWNVHNFPKVYLSNSNEPLNTIWNPAHPREISFIAHSFPNAKEDVYYYIGKERDDTLPVTLSSFSLTQIGISTVRITWVTQSETNIMGYYIYRATQSDLNTASNLNYLIPATNSSQLQIYTYTDQVTSNNIYYYWLEIVDYDGYNSFYGPAVIEINDNGNQTPSIPVKAGFYSFAPNPFDSGTKIFYGIPSKSPVLMQVYNIKGQKIRTLLNETKDSGNYDLFWDGRDEKGNLLANGNYILRLFASGSSWTKKITILH